MAIGYRLRVVIMPARLGSRLTQLLVGFSLAVSLGSFALAASQQGTVYLWVDKNGTPHYEDRPNEAVDSKEMNIRYQLSNPQAQAGANQKKADVADAAKTREKQDAADKSKDKTVAQQTTDERNENCKAAKERLEKYETAHKLYKPMPNGERQYLNDQDIDAARAEARKTVDEWCTSK
jgi:Domain of unknown function (DUF4124)